MHVRIKGLHRVTKRLSDGTIAVYFYAWRGGPRLRGKPGSVEFQASHAEAVAERLKPRTDIINGVLRAYQMSDDFRRLSQRTRRDYISKIMLIEREFGDLPVTALGDRRTRGVLMVWRDELAARSRRQADYAWSVLARCLAWALNRGLVPSNPCTKGGRLYRGSRSASVWSSDDETSFLGSAPAHLHLPLVLALWTGQRQGDLLRLNWSAYDGACIRLQQSKTGVRVVIPVGAPLKRALDAVVGERDATILLNSVGKPWTAEGFQSSWRKACVSAGIVGLTFNDLRGTAVTRLALAGATEAEIATITGHSLRDVRSILDSSYLHRDPALAVSAIRKLEMGTKM